jgi:phospholipase D1/2
LYRWIAIKDTYIVSLNKKNNSTIDFVFLVDKAFRFKKVKKPNGLNSIELKNSQNKLVLKFSNSGQQKNWFNKLTNMINNSAKYFHNSDLLLNDSFAPLRDNQLCQWFINAEQYMEAVMLALYHAKEEIYITDWWLCPELFLKRPSIDPEHRLDKILLKKANEGVRVYVLLYKEITLALNLMSLRAKSVLTQNFTNPNIFVLRDPNQSPNSLTIWSHHEKSVIVDQTIAFLGGIDLCYGRWDNEKYK